MWAGVAHSPGMYLPGAALFNNFLNMELSFKCNVSVSVTQTTLGNQYILVLYSYETCQGAGAVLEMCNCGGEWISRGGHNALLMCSHSQHAHLFNAFIVY